MFPLTVWLIEGKPRPIQVDAGLGDVGRMNRDAGHVLAEPIVQEPEQKIRAQLSRFGYRPEDIGNVILKLLDFDYVDQLGLFNKAEIVVSKKGLEGAQAALPSRAPDETMEILTGSGANRVVPWIMSR